MKREKESERGRERERERERETDRRAGIFSSHSFRCVNVFKGIAVSEHCSKNTLTFGRLKK